MSKGHKIDITNIKNFFDLILFDKNASREEVHNFLRDCLKFVFDYHNIDINNYKIQIHGVKFDKDDNESARVEQDSSHPNWFDVYLNNDHMIFKKFSKENLQNLYCLMFTSMHEFGHIVQFITHPKYVKNFKTREHDVLVNLTKTLHHNDYKNQKLIAKQYNKHEMAQESISNIERNADYQAYKYCQILFRTMYSNEDHEIIKSFFLLGIQYFNKIRKNRYVLYRKSDKSNKQALKCLEKYGIKEEDLLNK